MAKFVLIYSGGMGMGASPEDQEKIMADWSAWYGEMGASIVDGGAPFGASKHITANGVADGPGNSPATGYTIIDADSLGSAVQKCENHPHVDHGGQVHVFEYIDMG